MCASLFVDYTNTMSAKLLTMQRPVSVINDYADTVLA